MPTYRLVLEYDGTEYVGWQRQPVGSSIQGMLERALAEVMDEPSVALRAAGRTDSGVHALGQVASFSSDTVRDPSALRMGLNSLLPRDIVCRAAARVEDGFDALRRARGKHYRYRILDGGRRAALRARFLWQVRPALDEDAMRAAAAYLEGEHDFTSFRARGSSAASSTRLLRSIAVQRCEDELRIDVRGVGFLRHMIRIITGSLVDVGRGRWPPEQMTDVLAARDRSRAGKTAPACGLCLLTVFYDDGAG